MGEGRPPQPKAAWLEGPTRGRHSARLRPFRRMAGRLGRAVCATGEEGPDSGGRCGSLFGSEFALQRSTYAAEGRSPPLGGTPSPIGVLAPQPTSAEHLGDVVSHEAKHAQRPNGDAPHRQIRTPNANLGLSIVVTAVRQPRATAPVAPRNKSGAVPAIGLFPSRNAGSGSETAHLQGGNEPRT